MNQKKRDLTEWERSECAALKAAIEEYNRARPKHSRITQEQAGAALGMNQGSFSNYLNGRLAINLDFALKVSRLFDIPIERFSKRLAEEVDAISSIAPKILETDHFQPLPKYDQDVFDKVKFPKTLKLKDMEDYILSNDRMTVNVYSKSPLNVRESPARSLPHAIHSGNGSASQVRLRHLIEKLQYAVDHDRIAEKDFELLESMLDRFMDLGAPYQRESNEHFEKH